MSNQRKKNHLRGRAFIAGLLLILVTSNSGGASDPHHICNALSEIGFAQSKWKESRTVQGEYLCSPYGSAVELGSAAMPTNISYFVLGDVKQVNRVVLKLNLNDQRTMDSGKMWFNTAYEKIADALHVDRSSELLNETLQWRPGGRDKSLYTYSGGEFRIMLSQSRNITLQIEFER